MNKLNVFILSEDGTYLEKEALDMIIKVIEGRSEIANNPKMNHILMKAAIENGRLIKNAHNEPLYLLGEIEESEYHPMVVAWDENEEGFPKPRFLVSDEEIKALSKALFEDQKTDAWKTAIRVNKEIRAQQNP